MTQVVCYLKKCIHNEDNVCTKDVIMLDDEHFCNGGCDDGWEFVQKEDNDYIRRQDVVDEINTNADDLEQNSGIPYAQGARAMAIVVEQMPPANVAPVVRCRDCKYNASTHKCLNPDSFFLVPQDDDFCNYGERREE